MESNLSANPFLIAGVESCGAAARGWPTASAVGLGIENLSREAAKESPPGPNSVAPDGAFREGAWFPTAHAVSYHLPPLRRAAAVQILICAPRAATAAFCRCTAAFEVPRIIVEKLLPRGSVV